MKDIRNFINEASRKPRYIIEYIDKNGHKDACESNDYLHDPRYLNSEGAEVYYSSASNFSELKSLCCFRGTETYWHNILTNSENPSQADIHSTILKGRQLDELRSKYKGK